MVVKRSWDGFSWNIREEAFVRHDDITLTMREASVLKTLTVLSSKDKVFADVGSHVGYYTIRMSGLYKRVHAFEPNPFSLENLRVNIELNNLNNVTIHPLGLGDANTEAILYSSRDMATFLPRKERKAIKTVMRRFDDEVDHVDVVKVDVEGFEEKVLLGASRLIHTSKPIWIIEHHEGDFYPEVKGSFVRIRRILKDYLRVTLDAARYAYIHRDKIEEIPDKVKSRMFSYHICNMIVQNVMSGTVWYYGLPFDWWHGMGFMDFILELPDHVFEEKEWMELIERT